MCTLQVRMPTGVAQGLLRLHGWSMMVLWHFAACMVRRYYKYVRQEMLKNFQAGTGCRGVPMSLPRLVELVRACAQSTCLA